MNPRGCRRATRRAPSTGRSLNATSLRKLPQGSVQGSLLLLLLFASCMYTCKGAPLSLQTLQGEQELQLWHEIDNTCSAFLSTDPQSQASSGLEELCFMVMGILQKSQGLDEKDNAKRFLFHYAKTHDSGNSDIMSSVLHPLLQLVPQLHERRMKRFKTDRKVGARNVQDTFQTRNLLRSDPANLLAEGELQGPGGIQSRGYFLFRPRNGRRAAGFF